MKEENFEKEISPPKTFLDKILNYDRLSDEEKTEFSSDLDLYWEGHA